MFVGKHVIERGQYIPALRMGRNQSNKVVGEIQFLFPGNEMEIIHVAVEPIQSVLAKLHLFGVFAVSDRLLMQLSDAYPLLRTVKIVSQAVEQTLSGPGLTYLASKLGSLQVLYISASALETIDLVSPSLHRLALIGLKKVQ
jgi:hypothetical protein